MTQKKVVLYREVQNPITVGNVAVVFPLNHPDFLRVSNKDWAITSRVVAVGEKGEFETLNTIYRPA